MSVTRLASGRWRSQVYDARAGKSVSSAKVLGHARGSYRTKTEAKAARAEARKVLAGGDSADGVTVGEFWRRWTTDPLFARPKWSTDIHNRERTKAFAERYADTQLRHVGDLVVAQWLAGGKRNGTVPALRAMFNDARSAKAGRLIDVNPFAGLGIAKTRGNKDRQPPTQEQMEAMITLARANTPPSFACYLEFACVTGARPSELDALKHSAIDLRAGEVHLREQWNAKTRTFTPPKYGPYTIALVARGREVLQRLPREDVRGDFVFVTLRGTHYTPSSRTHHWNRVRTAAGLDTTLYLATRHYFGWYAINVLELDPAIVAQQLGHKDGGKLVEQLYGHPDKARRRRLLREAHDAHGQLRPLRVIDETEAG